MKIKYHNRGELTLRVFLGMYFFSLSFIISAVAGACLLKSIVYLHYQSYYSPRFLERKKSQETLNSCIFFPDQHALRKL